MVYEKVAETVWKSLDKSTASPGLQTTVNLGSGLIAGFAAALVSQPADTMLSKINKTKGLPGEGTTSRLIKIAKELGFRGSYSGIGARLFMVGTLTAGQFAIYVCVVRSITLLSLTLDRAILRRLSAQRAELRLLQSRCKRQGLILRRWKRRRRYRERG